MKSNEALLKKYKISQHELLTALRNCISHFLSEEELEPFILAIKSRRKKARKFTIK